MSRNHDNLRILEIDLKDINKYDDLSKEVEKIVTGNGLNVLFNNAGVSPKFTRLQLVKSDQLHDTFLVNVIAPIMLAKVIISSLYRQFLIIRKNRINNRTLRKLYKILLFNVKSFRRYSHN